jgi:WG containing repeat
MKWLPFFATALVAFLFAVPLITFSPAPRTQIHQHSTDLVIPDPPFPSALHQAGLKGLRPVFWADSNRMGYQDSSGAWRIPPRFLRALPFNEGLAGVCLGDAESSACGFIDTLGNWRIEPLFPRILFGFQEGFAIVSLPGLIESPFGFIDSSGGVRFSQVFPMAKPFFRGESWVQCGPNSLLGRPYAWGRIDTLGQWIEPCEQGAPAPQWVGRFP